MGRSQILLIVAAVLGLGAGPAEPLHVRVVGVHDGDTLTALTADRTQLKVRLHGIDAPELGQPFGQASKRALSGLVFGKQVTLHTTGTDRSQCPRSITVRMFALTRVASAIRAIE